jgi:SAM-dependent methyltransferase
MSVNGTLIDQMRLTPGEKVLDVGCGSGAVDRWLARRTAEANPIVAIDINRYLLKEAEGLARREGLLGAIEFREGNAEALPFPDNTFDVAISVTVLEEVDADRALAEMVRVIKPGGRVGVVVRGTDMPRYVNLLLRPELKAKLEAPGFGPAGVSERGCGDASLYRRFLEGGLTQVWMSPQMMSMGSASIGTVQGLRRLLNDEEALELDAALAQAQAEGTFFVAAMPHCAVGTKP